MLRKITSLFPRRNSKLIGFGLALSPVSVCFVWLIKIVRGSLAFLAVLPATRGLACSVFALTGYMSDLAVALSVLFSHRSRPSSLFTEAVSFACKPLHQIHYHSFLICGPHLVSLSVHATRTIFGTLRTSHSLPNSCSMRTVSCMPFPSDVWIMIPFFFSRYRV